MTAPKPDAASHIKLPTRVIPAPDLLRFSREDRLLLVNGAFMLPLLVPQGGEAVDELLHLADKVRSVPELLARGTSEELLRALVSHQILVPEKSRRPKGDPRPCQTGGPVKGTSLYLLLAQNCNLGCVYCLNGDETYQRKSARRMSRDVAFAAVDTCMSRLDSGGRLEIVFFGGEPLLNWPLAKEIIAFTETEIAEKYPDRRWHFHLTSNLLKLPDDLVEVLIEHQVTVLCDVDGPPELHDLTRPLRGGGPSAERINRNTAKLVDAGVKVALRATITSANVDCMVDIARQHKKLRGQGTSVVAVNAVNSDEDVLAEKMLPDPEAFARGMIGILEAGDWPIESIFPMNHFQNQLRPGVRDSIACGAPYGNTPVVDVDGDIYACIYLVGIPDYRLGNVFDRVTFPDPAVVGRMMDILHVDAQETCRDCAYRYVCVGGCPIGRLTIAANPKASERVRRYQREVRCATVRAAVEALLWRVAQQAAEGSQRNALDQATVPET